MFLSTHNWARKSEWEIPKCVWLARFYVLKCLELSAHKIIVRETRCWCPMTFNKSKIEKKVHCSPNWESTSFRRASTAVFGIRIQENEEGHLLDNFLFWWKWKHTPRLHEWDRNDHKEHWFNLLVKRTVEFFQIPQKPKPVEVQTAVILRRKIINKGFRLWK